MKQIIAATNLNVSGAEKARGRTVAPFFSGVSFDTVSLSNVSRVY